MTFEALARALAHVGTFVLVGWSAGELLAAWLTRGGSLMAGDERARAPEPRRPGERPPLGLPERALLALVGFAALSCVLMVVHLITGGAVFGTTAPVPLAALATVGAAWRLRPRQVAPPWALGLVVAGLLALVFIAPVIQGGTGARTGDLPWHLGWTEQLLAGEPVPTGPAPELGANAYPWGFHALLATMTRLVPTADPLSAHDGLHMVLVVAVPLGAACLARSVDRRAGWFAALSAGLVGGFGWVLATRPDLVTSPSHARYGADLVVASPNSVYELFPPALPREVGVVLLAAAGALLAMCHRAPDRRGRLLAGVVLGLTGLVSVPMLVAGGLWVIGLTLLSPRRSRLRSMLEIAAPAALVFALWAGPVLADYVRYGGFVSITPELGVEWSLPTALGSWGLLLPAAAAGGLLAGGRVEGRALLAFCSATILLLALALLRGAFDWRLAGNATLLHQGRVWPVAHLLAAALAGIWLARAFDRLVLRARPLAVVGATAVFTVGALSPALASMRMSEVLERDEGGFGYDRPDLSRGSFVRRAAERLGPDDLVRVEGSDRLAFLLWQFSGVRLAAFDDPRLPGNDLRIRYRDLARAWDERMSTGGFEADYVVDLSRASAGTIVKGEYDGQSWALIRPML